jgi:hypothetical protein
MMLSGRCVRNNSYDEEEEDGVDDNVGTTTESTLF